MINSEADSEDSEEESEEESEEAPEEKVAKKGKEKGKKPLETGADVLEGRSVFLRNISFDATEEELTEMVSPYGNVLKCRIVRNNVGASKGVAFVEFESKAEADECVVNSKDLELKGRPVFARTALPQTEIHVIKAKSDESKNAKRDKRNLALAREGEIREGTKAWEVRMQFMSYLHALIITYREIGMIPLAHIENGSV